MVHLPKISYQLIILRSTLNLSGIKNIQIRQTKHAGHCRRNKDGLIIDFRQWTPSNGRASVGRPTRTYLQELCMDTECCLEDLSETMDDRDKWQERERERKRERERVNICLCLPPDRTWHKVNDPKVDCSGDLGEGKVGHEPRLKSCLTMLVIGPLGAMWAWRA